MEELRNVFAGLIVYEEGLKEENQKIKGRVVMFGVVSVIVMILTTWMQIKYLKNFFRYKKII